MTGRTLRAQMHVDEVELRERMRSRRTEDLQQIIQNARGDYTRAAVQAALHEVATRPGGAGVIDDNFSRPSAGESLRSRLPGGIWLVFCLASGTAALGIITICVALTFAFVHAITLGELLPSLGSAFATAAVASFIAVSIRAERSYVQVLLLSLIVAAGVYRVALAMIDRSLTLNEIGTFELFVVAFWYFKYSDSVSRYYRILRASVGYQPPRPPEHDVSTSAIT
jgi:hypothetical protein